MFVTPVYVQFLSCCMFIEFCAVKVLLAVFMPAFIVEGGEESADFLMLIRMTFANDNV